MILNKHVLLVLIVCLLYLPGASCGPGAREGFLPTGDPETGASAEESTEASGRL